VSKRKPIYAGVTESCVAEHVARALRLADGNVKLARDHLLLFAAGNETLREGLMREGIGKVLTVDPSLKQMLAATGGLYLANHRDEDAPIA
jgi:hypothetical protein